MFTSAFTIEKNQKLLKKGDKDRFAIIDLGTNSVRFDIYRLNNRRVTRLHRGKRMIRLGDGVFKTGTLTPEAMARTFRAFQSIRRQLIEARVIHVVAFGTSALRTATNSKDFLEEIRRRTGITVRIISGQEEGRLIARGIMESIPAPKGWYAVKGRHAVKGRYAMVDIGGGSTEISVAAGKKLMSCQSFSLGANRLQQTYLKTVPPQHKRGELNPILALRQHLKDTLYPLTQLRVRMPVKTLIGSSGTIRTIGKMLKKLGRSNTPIYRADLSALIAEMQTMTRAQLLRLPALEPKRVDLILAGAVLLEEVMLAFNMRTLHVTDIALRDGILCQELEKRGLS